MAEITLPKGYTPITVFVAILLIVSATYEVLTQKNIDLPLSNTLKNFNLEEVKINESLPTEEQFFTLTRVVDGDTVEIDFVGLKEKVRLIGINTPETVDPRRPVECFGKEASARMKDLAQGKKVRIEYDPSQGYRDTYDRVLAYVYLEDGQMLNRKMLAEGYAYEYTYTTPYKYQKEFRALVALARTSERGLWSPKACANEE